MLGTWNTSGVVDIKCEGDYVCQSEEWEKVGVEQRLGLTEIEDWPEE